MIDRGEGQDIMVFHDSLGPGARPDRASPMARGPVGAPEQPPRRSSTIRGFGEGAACTNSIARELRARQILSETRPIAGPSARPLSRNLPVSNRHEEVPDGTDPARNSTESGLSWPPSPQARRALLRSVNHQPRPRRQSRPGRGARQSARSEPVLRALVWPAGGARWASGPGPTPLWPQRRRNLRLDDRGGGQPRRRRKGSGGSWKLLIDAPAARPVP